MTIEEAFGPIISTVAGTPVTIAVVTPYPLVLKFTVPEERVVNLVRLTSFLVAQGETASALVRDKESGSWSFTAPLKDE